MTFTQLRATTANVAILDGTHVGEQIPLDSGDQPVAVKPQVDTRFQLQQDRMLSHSSNRK